MKLTQNMTLLFKEVFDLLEHGRSYVWLPLQKK